MRVIVVWQNSQCIFCWSQSLVRKIKMICGLQCFVKYVYGNRHRYHQFSCLTEGTAFFERVTKNLNNFIFHIFVSFSLSSETLATLSRRNDCTPSGSSIWCCFKWWYKYAKCTIKSVILVLSDDINTQNVQ